MFQPPAPAGGGEGRADAMPLRLGLPLHPGFPKAIRGKPLLGLASPGALLWDGGMAGLLLRSAARCRIIMQAETQPLFYRVFNSTSPTNLNASVIHLTFGCW